MILPAEGLDLLSNFWHLLSIPPEETWFVPCFFAAFRQVDIFSHDKNGVEPQAVISRSTSWIPTKVKMEAENTGRNILQTTIFFWISHVGCCRGNHQTPCGVFPVTVIHLFTLCRCITPRSYQVTYPILEVAESFDDFLGCESFWGFQLNGGLDPNKKLQDHFFFQEIFWWAAGAENEPWRGLKIELEVFGRSFRCCSCTFFVGFDMSLCTFLLF